MCADPYNNGCTEACQTACTTGECPSPNIQAAVTSFSVVLPYPWRDDMGAGYPMDFGSTYRQPITFATARTETSARRRQLLKDATGETGREVMAFSGEISETIGTFGTNVDPYTIMTQLHEAGHALVQWQVTIDFAQPVENFDWQDSVVSGCYPSGFEAHSDTQFTVTLTACDPQHRGVSPENNLEHMSGRLLKYHGNVRTDPSADGGGKCVFRIPDRAYNFKSPVDFCPTSEDDVGEDVEGGQTTCGKGTVIPNMASDVLTLPYNEFVAKCPSNYPNRHRTAESLSVLSDTLEQLASTFKDVLLI